MQKKIFLAHNACLNAAYDLNVLEAGLIQTGFEVVDSPESADEIFFSGCSVREHWVDDAISQIAEARSRAPHAKITVTGCAANTSAAAIAGRLPETIVAFRSMKEILQDRTGRAFSDVDRDLSQTSSIRFESKGLRNLRRRVGVLKAAIVAELEEIDRKFETSTARSYRQTTKGFVFYDEVDPCEMITVTRSCLYRCSFCNIPQGRGAFESVPSQDVLSKARLAIAGGNRHIVLIGDEVGNYGVGTGGLDLPQLIEAILALDPGVVLSIRYIEPKPFLKHAERLMAWSKAGRIRLLYVSLQSGSQRVLKGMNRGYDIKHLAQTLQEFRARTSTVFYGNWMVGFPGEEEQDFLETVSLVRELAFQINAAIPFSARPNTVAEGMAGQVDQMVLDDRLRRLTEAIAWCKSEAMASVLGLVEPTARAGLLERVRLAEAEQYSPEPDSPADQSPSPR